MSSQGSAALWALALSSLPSSLTLSKRKKTWQPTTPKPHLLYLPFPGVACSLLPKLYGMDLTSSLWFGGHEQGHKRVEQGLQDSEGWSRCGEGPFQMPGREVSSAKATGTLFLFFHCVHLEKALKISAHPQM